MRTPPRRIRSRLESGQPVLGATLQMPSPETVEIAGYSGLDYVWIDAEHGTMDIRDIAEMVRAADACGVDAIIRVPDHNPSYIQRVLDLGAAGIIAPHVCDADQARGLVAAAKYAPEGTRGACPQTRAVGHVSTDWSADSRRSNADVLVFAMIEDFDGVENVESISQSGVDGLLFGSFDLSQSLGLDGSVDHTDLERMQNRVTSAVRSSGIEYITLGWDFDDFATICTYSRIFNVAADRPGLFNLFSSAITNKLAEIEKSGATYQLQRS